ncbi:hypothetical protein [Pyrococcus kukulkanii]|uniref:DUF357 domain-containing protein n=1 Tax=Pyrococcus kukulkanii TaxID=1609559 RepID=A0ABV4T6F6_9EURY
MSEAEFWEWVASEVRKAREAEQSRVSIVDLIEEELREARARKEYFFRKGDMEEFYYWEGYVGALLTVKGLLKKFGVV